MANTTLNLDDGLQSRILSLAGHYQRSTPEILQDAIRQYVEREEAKLSFREEADASWRDYQETGLHLTGEETLAWLETWGTDREGPAPECHV